MVKYPLTYSEKNGGEHGSNYLSMDIANFADIKVKGKKDVHTIEFLPGEMRNCGDAETIIRPLEKMNEFGLRGSVPLKNKKVVLCLGDSFTESVCVPVDSSYPVALQHLVQTVNSDIEVMNAGVSGSDPFYAHKLLQKLQPKLNISMVIMLFNTSDINDVMLSGGNERFHEDGTVSIVPTPWWERIYAFSYVFRLVAHNLFNVDFNSHTPMQAKLKRERALTQIDSLIRDEILPYCERNEITIKAVIHSMQHELYVTGSNDYSDLKKLLSNIFDENDLLDTRMALAKNSSTQSLYYPIDGHFNCVGYNLLANEIFSRLNQKYLRESR